MKLEEKIYLEQVLKSWKEQVDGTEHGKGYEKCIEDVIILIRCQS